MKRFFIVTGLLILCIWHLYADRIEDFTTKLAETDWTVLEQKEIRAIQEEWLDISGEMDPNPKWLSNGGELALLSGKPAEALLYFRAALYYRPFDKALLERMDVALIDLPAAEKETFAVQLLWLLKSLMHGFPGILILAVFSFPLLYVLFKRIRKPVILSSVIVAYLCGLFLFLVPFFVNHPKDWAVVSDEEMLYAADSSDAPLVDDPSITPGEILIIGESRLGWVKVGVLHSDQQGWLPENSLIRVPIKTR